MSETASKQALHPALERLVSMLTDRLTSGMPQTYEERRQLLEDHLRCVTAELQESEQSPESAWRPTDTTELVSQSILMARQVTAEIRQRAQLDISDCDHAAIEGVALITLGSLGGGPVGAVAGFIYGTVLLAHAC